MITRKGTQTCSECKAKQYEIKCPDCGAIRLSSAHYFIMHSGVHRCRSCAASGSNNSSYGKKWSEDKRRIQSELIKSKVDDSYRAKCSSAMKGKSISEDTKLKRKKTKEERRAAGKNKVNVIIS